MTLYEFYGEECPHCQEMESVVDSVEEEGFEIQQLEVWHDQDNAEKLEELDDGKCGGVPFFFNTETEEWICGETSFDTLLRWAQGEAV